MVQIIRLFVYPFKGVGAVTMTNDDVSRLSDGEFLNDNIIEFYLKWYLCSVLLTLQRSFVCMRR